METDTYLQRFHEEQPDWLRQCASGKMAGRPDMLSALLRSRTVFYPGSGTDGSPVSLFNRAHAAHCFIYCDSGLSLHELRKVLRDEPFRNYEAVSEILLSEGDLTAAGCSTPTGPGYLMFTPVTPYAMLVLFGRKPHKDNVHGADVFAVLFLGWDGFDAFETLYARRDESVPPFCVVLQDHGFGGNSSGKKFGGGGRLEGYAIASGSLPEFALVGHATNAWAGYAEPHEAGQCEEPLSGWRGGMHENLRRLMLRPGDFSSGRTRWRKTRRRILNEDRWTAQTSDVHEIYQWVGNIVASVPRDFQTRSPQERSKNVAIEPHQYTSDT
ncbi:hypothetical protein [Hyphomonas sp. BRH_c22]|uniref:hypothetical protein n=1 Tax=Hyphomonas sp. BRH_c22 TaxID=1629710 RepID=UPI000A6E2C08|nr:hypothetical protein [Hyphomonas sp. BRH_c22]